MGEAESLELQARVVCNVPSVDACPLLSVTKRQLDVMRVLSRTRPKRSSEIAEQLGRSKPHVYNDLRELERLGFARQLPDKRWVSTYGRIWIHLLDGTILVENCPGSPGCPGYGKA